MNFGQVLALRASLQRYLQAGCSRTKLTTQTAAKCERINLPLTAEVRTSTTMTCKRLLLLMIGALAVLVSICVWVWLSRASAPRVVRLLSLPPEQIALKSPLWGYLTAADLEWETQDLPSGLRKYSWSGCLDIDQEIPSLRVRVGEELLPEMEAGAKGESTQPGFVYSLERQEVAIAERMELNPGDHARRSAYIPSSSCVLDFEAQSASLEGMISLLSVSVDQIHAATLPIRSLNWNPFQVVIPSILAGTHTFEFALAGFSTVRGSEVFIRNVSLRKPTRIDVYQAPGDTTPVVEFRPTDPVSRIQKEVRPVPPTVDEPVRSPWETYDEDSRWVRSAEVGDLVRTGVFLPTPSTWVVDVTAEAGSVLVFYPAVHNTADPTTSGRANLEVYLEREAVRELLWSQPVGPEPERKSVVPEYPFFTPHSWQVYAEEREKPQPLWRDGVRIRLPDVITEGCRLIFQTSAIEPETPPQPVVLGEPLILPPPRVERVPSLLKVDDIVDWKPLFSQLTEASTQRTATPARRVWLLLDWRARVTIASITPEAEISEATKTLVVSHLNDLLSRPDFYLDNYFASIDLSDETKQAVQSLSDNSTVSEVQKTNRLLLKDCFPDLVVSGQRYQPQSSKRPNIVLISLDTLRADSLSCFGYHRVTSPWMDEFFRDRGVIFSHIEAPSTWTLPSHVGLFLSQFASRHGVNTSFQAIPAKDMTFAEWMADQGYETAAYVDRGFLHSRYGFHQGFHRFDQKGGGFSSIIPRCLEWMDTRDQTSPLFLFLHSYDIHTPYDPPHPFRERFLDENMKPKFAELTIPNHPVFQAANKGEIELVEEDIDYCRALYDAQVVYVDHCLKKFFEKIERRRLLENPMVIVFSDHGEGFAEHGLWDHGWSVYEELTRVPLLIRFPDDRFAGTKVDRRASLIDIPPTVVDMMGCPPPEDWQGVSLLPTIGETGVETERRVYSEIPNLAAMYRSDLKHIHNQGPLMTARGTVRDRIEVYDLEEDPGETRNLVHNTSDNATGEVERMTKALDLMIELRKGEGSIESTNLDPEAVRELQALGYLQ